MGNLPPQQPGKPGRPRNPYELVGLIKGLRPKQINNIDKKLHPMPAGEKLERQQILINILLSYINSPEVSLEVFKSGYDDVISNAIKESIGIPIPPPPPMI